MKSLNIRVAFSAIDKLTRPVNAARQSTGGLSESIKRTLSSIKDLDGQSRTFNRLRDSVQKTSRKIDDASRALEGLNRAQREGAQLTEKQKAHMAALAAKLERLNSARTQEMVKLRAASQALRSHGVSLVGSDRTIQSAIRRTEQYNNQLERQRQALVRLTQARERYSRAQETAGKLKAGGAVAVGAAAAGGYAAGRFLQPAIGFGKEMSRVQALTRMDGDDPQLEALRAQAKKLGSETSFSASDAARGQSFLAMAGFTPEAIRAALPGVLDMAKAGDIDLGETADIGSNILSQFQLDASQMDRVGDVLTGTFTRTNTDLRELGNTMKYAGPVAAGLGISLEETATIIGSLARIGIKGSDAGTALRASLSRLASPPRQAREALRELGVEVADSTGKMRKPFELLLDMQKKLAKYGQVDRISFLKSIAGEEAFVGLKAIIDSAGDGYLDELYAGISQAHEKGESRKVAATMANNLDGDILGLSSAFEGLRIAVAENLEQPLRRLTQSLSSVIRGVTLWVEANPELATTIMVIGGSALALTAAIGGVSLAAGLLIGPLSRLRLGFSLLTGGRGITGAVTAFRALGTASGPAMANVRGWGPVLGSLAAKMRGISIIAPGLRGALVGAFLAPGAAMGGLVKNIGILAFRLIGLKAIWGVLGPALSLLFSPIGLLVAALVGGALLIWKYWEPIKAFFEGVFSIIMEKLAPLRESFARFSPIFDAIGSAISQVFDWFKSLLTPMESSKETLDKCASAGEVFGSVLGGALQLVLTPAKMLLDTLAWILEKLGVLPDEAEKSRKKIEEAQRMAVLQDKVALLQGDIAWIAPAKAEKKGAPSGKPKPKPEDTPPLGGDNGTLRRLQNIENNTKATASNTKRIGPGDIVFKNLPRALAVRGEWKESQLATSSVAERLSARPVVSPSARVAGSATTLPSPAQTITVMGRSNDHPGVVAVAGLTDRAGMPGANAAIEKPHPVPQLWEQLGSRPAVSPSARGAGGVMADPVDGAVRSIADRLSTLPPAVAAAQSRSYADALSARPAMVAASLPVRQAAIPPVSRASSATPPAVGGFTGEIHVHLHGIERQDAREIGRIVADAVNAELARRERLSRGSFKDRD